MNNRFSPGVHITQSQPEHLAASQPAQQHRLHHRPVPMGAQRPYQGVGLLWVDHPRQRARGADQRYPFASRGWDYGSTILAARGFSKRHRGR